MAQLKDGKIQVYSVQVDGFVDLTIEMVEAMEATVQNFGRLVTGVEELRKNNLAEVQAIMRGDKAHG